MPLKSPFVPPQAPPLTSCGPPTFAGRCHKGVLWQPTSHTSRATPRLRPHIAGLYIYIITLAGLGQRRNVVESQTTHFPLSARVLVASSLSLHPLQIPSCAVRATSAHHGLHRHVSSPSSGSCGALSHMHTLSSGCAINNRQSTTFSGNITLVLFSFPPSSSSCTDRLSAIYGHGTQECHF